MVKENTHLQGAYKMFDLMDNSEIKKLIKKYKPYYKIGSIAPDTFFYFRSRKAFSEKIHSTPFIKTLLKIMDVAKKEKSKRELVFAMGVITHAVLDMEFHPFVFHFTRKSKKDQEYMHTLIETYIDNKLEHEFHFNKFIDADKIDHLRFFKNIKDARKILKLQIRVNRAFRTKVWYYFAQFLRLIGVLSIKGMGLFYVRLNADKFTLAEKLEFMDPVRKKMKTSTIRKLMNNAIKKGIKNIKATYDYYNDVIDRKQLERIIDKKNLDYGKI